MVATKVSVLFLVILWYLKQFKAADSPCQQQQFNELLASVQSAYNDLEKLTQLAEGKGIECTYERITMNTTQLFLNFSSYDFNSTDVLCDAYRNWYGANGCALGEAVPCRELNQTLDILTRATADIKKLLSTPGPRRRPVPPHLMHGTVAKGSYLYRDGDLTKPVFPGGYDHGNYAFYYGFPSDVVPQVKTVGQDSEEVVAHIATLLPTPDGVNGSEVQRIVDSFDQLYQFGVSSGLVLMCNLPDWVVQKYPDIAWYMQSSCKYNIDHPMIRTLWEQGLTALIGKLKSHPALHSFRLGNEVYFGIIGNKTAISTYTTEKWHTWLKNKYGDINSLNEAWKASYKNFSEVFFPNKKDKDSGSLYGTAQWYDFCRFNADRVLDYYTWFIGLVRKLDPDTPCHVKYVNRDLFVATMASGLDRFALDKLTNWSGCDTRIMTAPTAMIDTPNRNSGQYALDWLTTIGYTWMRSTAPDKLVIDMEIHPISTVRQRNGSTPDNHMTAATWIAHLQGLSLHLLWAWPRLANGSYRFDIVDTLPTLPQAVDSYARSLAYINALGPEVVALASTAPRPVCMLWSVISSMQDKSYLNAQNDAFEALSFFGPQPWFIAEPDINEKGIDSSCKVLVVPGQRYVSDNTVLAVKKYVAQGGNIVVIGNSSVFNYNEAGVQRPSSALEWLKNLTYIADQDPTKLLRAMELHLQPAAAKRLVTCVSATTDSEETRTMETAWGVICRAAKIDDGVVTALVNVLTVPVSLKLYDGSGESITNAVDMYMYESVDLSMPLVLQSLQVRILLIH